MGRGMRLRLIFYRSVQNGHVEGLGTNSKKCRGDVRVISGGFCTDRLTELTEITFVYRASFLINFEFKLTSCCQNSALSKAIVC